MLWRNALIAGLGAAIYCYLYDSPPLYPFLVAAGGVALFSILGLLFDPFIYTTSHDKFRSGDTRRRPGEIPPVYPNGWWVVLHSHELGVGEAKPVEFMGHSLVAWRGENGSVSVLDAYCPHLGAHLGIESKVLSNSLECPFHGWQFDQDGKCTLIPGQQMIPESSQLRKWFVADANDKIYVWHHAEKKEPEWWPEEFVCGFDFHGKTLHTVAVHCQEIAENGPDASHLNFLHRPLFGLGPRKVINHIWEASWQPGKEDIGEKHLAYITVKQGMQIFGKNIPFLSNTVTIRQVGPGMVHLDFPLFLGLHFRIMENVTPIAPLMQRVRHSIYASHWTPRVFAKIFLKLMVSLFEQDVAIWNNKTYKHKPLYAKPDKAIPVYRRWYQQFYTESSPKAGELLNPLECTMYF